MLGIAGIGGDEVTEDCGVREGERGRIEGTGQVEGGMVARRL